MYYPGDMCQFEALRPFWEQQVSMICIMPTILSGLHEFEHAQCVSIRKCTEMAVPDTSVLVGGVWVQC